MTFPNKPSILDTIYYFKKGETFYNMLKVVPMFDRTGVWDAASHIAHVENMCALMVPMELNAEAMAMNLFHRRLSGEVTEWFLTELDHNVTWDTCKELFLKRFTRGGGVAKEQVKQGAVEQVQLARREEWPRHVYEERVAQAQPKRIPNPASFPQPSLLPKMEATSPKSPHLIPPHKMIAKRKKEERMQKLIVITEELQKEQVILFESISKINKRMDDMHSKVISLFEEMFGGYFVPTPKPLVARNGRKSGMDSDEEQEDNSDDDSIFSYGSHGNSNPIC